MAQLASIFVLIIGIVSFVANGILLLVLLKDPLKFFKASAAYFIISLAAADMITGANACAFGIDHLLGPFPLIYQRYLLSLFWISVQASFLTLLAMSFERFMAVKFPFRCRAWITKKRACLAISLIWLISILLGGLVLLPESQALYVQFSIYTEFFVAVFIIVGLYTFIIGGVRHSQKLLKKSGRSHQGGSSQYETDGRAPNSTSITSKTKSSYDVSVALVTEEKPTRKLCGCSPKLTRVNALCDKPDLENGDAKPVTAQVARYSRISLEKDAGLRRQSTRQRLRNTIQQKKLTAVVLLLVGVLAVTVLPYLLISQILTGYLIFCDCFPPWTWLAKFTEIYFPIELLNFAVNPLIYAWRLPQYRKTLRYFFTGKMEFRCQATTEQARLSDSRI